MVELLWQLKVIALILIAFGIAYWVSRRYQGWLRKKYPSSSRWGVASAWSMGIVLFVFLAVVFGFVLDTI